MKLFYKQSLIPAVTWGFLILYLTLRPKSDNTELNLPSWLQGFPLDKFAHALFWNLWYLIYWYFYVKQNSIKNGSSQRVFPKFKTIEFWGVSVMIAVGGLIEILQHQLNWGREAEWLDLFADALGVYLAFVWSSWILTIKKPLHNRGF